MFSICYVGNWLVGLYVCIKLTPSTSNVGELNSEPSVKFFNSLVLFNFSLTDKNKKLMAKLPTKFMLMKFM